MILTDAGLDVDVVAPLAVPQTADQSRVGACAGEAPALSSGHAIEISHFYIHKVSTCRNI